MSTDETIYFDCNASFGSPMAGLVRPCQTASDLLAEMDWCGVERALVWHTLMKEQSPVVGNRVLAETIAGQPRLVGAWAILPPQTGELPAEAAFFEAMQHDGARALWAFADEHRYLLNRTTWGSFLDEVAERRVPLFVPRHSALRTSPSSMWRDIHGLLADYPTLTLVIAAHGCWGEDRYFRPLLEAYPNVHLDLSRYEVDGGLLGLVQRYGPERLLYGSAFPETPMGGARMMLARAAVSPEARRLIAGGNLERLLAKVVLS
jgi:predicted TIM-barrel fold metal-dependent hydrolase